MTLQIEHPETYQVAVYIRLSKDDDREGESQSVTNQREMIGTFLQERRLTIYDEYVDDGWSGGNFDRPAFQRMIGDIEAGKVNMVVTKDLSRLGRDIGMTNYYFETYFKIRKVRYLTLSDGVDTGTESSANDIAPFYTVMNDQYAKDISRKIKSVKHDKQKKGLFIGGKAPFGYVLSKLEKNKLEIDPDAAPTVRRIFAMALSGISCRQITVKLNEEKIPPPSVYANLTPGRIGPYAGLWSSERVTEMLRSQMYIGNMVQGRTKKISYKIKQCEKIAREDWIVVENTHAPIIDKDTFAQVQQMIDSRRYTRSRKYEYPLKGLIICHECGYPLAVINRKNAAGDDTLYFVCRTYQRFTSVGACTAHCIKEQRVTDAVLSQVRFICKRFVIRDKLAQQGVSVIKRMEAARNIQQKLDQIRGKLAQIDQKIEKTYNEKLNDTLAERDFRRIYERLCADRELLETNKQTLETELGKAPKDYHEQAVALAQRFLESEECDRELLVALVEQVELNERKEITIKFRFREIGMEQRAVNQ